MHTRTEAPLFRAGHFKLGIFGANCSGGHSPTTVAERWDASWPHNLRLGQLADAAGIDFLLPIARWIGYGGVTDFQGYVLETTTWATGLLAATQHITVFTTAHTTFHHPAVMAKQIATMDAIGAGRVGLNIVCGWNKPEFEMFGMTLPDDHETRYAYGEEWFEIVRNLWQASEPFDWDGRYFKLRGAYGRPQPLRGLPPIINAAGSKEGRGFATRYADFLLTPAIDLDRSREEVAALKQQAAAVGRQVEVLTFSQVVCRPTRKEAEDFVHWYAHEHADEGAVDNLMRLMFSHAQSFPHDLQRMIRERMAIGHGGYPLIGTPDDVVAGIERVQATGFAGTTLSFLDYVAELPYFCAEVLPRLEARGVRLRPPRP